MPIQPNVKAYIKKAALTHIKDGGAGDAVFTFTLHSNIIGHDTASLPNPPTQAEWTQRIRNSIVAFLEEEGITIRQAAEPEKKTGPIKGWIRRQLDFRDPHFEISVAGEHYQAARNIIDKITASRNPRQAV